jgi:hypothetical protein
MDFSKLTDKIGDLAEQGGNLIEGAATSLKDKVTDLVPDSVKDKVADAATTVMGKAADKLSRDAPANDPVSPAK